MSFDAAWWKPGVFVVSAAPLSRAQPQMSLKANCIGNGGAFLIRPVELIISVKASHETDLRNVNSLLRFQWTAWEDFSE